MKNLKYPLSTSPVIGDDDNGIRPKKLDEFVGQTHIIGQLKVIIQAAQIRNKPPDHILLAGLPGLGKTTLAVIIANETGGKLISASGPALDRVGLITILVGLRTGDVFFIDEIHRLSQVLEEILYPAMEDFYIDLVLLEGDSKRAKKIKLDKFTLIGATTRAGLLTAPFRDRFGFVGRLDLYGVDDLVKVLYRSSSILGFPITPESAMEIAKRSRGTPRVANRLLKRMIDYALVGGIREINRQFCVKIFMILGIDPNGLDNIDRRILEIMIKDFSGGPVGLKNIAVSLGEDVRTIEDIYEPFLIHEGLIKRAARGREVTKKGKNYEYLSDEIKKIKDEEITDIRIVIRGKKDDNKKVEKKVADGEIISIDVLNKKIDGKDIDVDGIVGDVINDIKNMAKEKVKRDGTSISLVNPSAIQQRKYRNYATAMMDIIPCLENEIENSIDKKIKVYLKDLKKLMGGEFVKLETNTFLKGVKYTLGCTGFKVDGIFKKNNDDVLVLALID